MNSFSGSDVLKAMASPFISLESRLAAQVPAIVAALLLLIIGLFVSRALRSAVEGALARLKLDDYAGKVGINEVIARLGLGKSPAYVLGFLAYWFVLFVFIVSAANAAGVSVVSTLLSRFALFLPAVVAALLILFGGLLFARFLSEIVANAARTNNVRGGAALAKGCYLVVVVFSAMTALQQLGLQMGLISSAIQIFLAAAGLAAALAFGLGGKEVAAEIIREWTGRGGPKSGA